MAQTRLPVALSPVIGRDSVVALAVFLVTSCLFLRAPVSMVSDSRYSLLLTQSLLSRGTFRLDGYGIPRRPRVEIHGFYLNGDIYQIEVVGDHLYAYFPPGGPILSAPFMLLANVFCKPVVRPDGTYSLDREIREQRFIAGLLMAILAGLFFLTARLLLSTAWSALIALGGALGTQVWSTASRALWGHTWSIALLGFVVFLLLSCETGRRPLRPVLLATLLSWTYFVRPTNSLFIVGVTVYILLYHHSVFLPYAATGAAWLAGFVVYSESHFGKLLPSYFQANRLEAGQFWEAVIGNLISPSRGVFVFVPVSLFVVYLVLRYHRHLRCPRLVALVATASVCQLVAVSCFVPWYGGACFGPRYLTELVPWFVLLAVLGTDAALRHREEVVPPHGLSAWRITLGVGALLLLISVAVNARGACSWAPTAWNQRPVDIDADPSRVWDWWHPQFLAGMFESVSPAPTSEGARTAR